MEVRIMGNPFVHVELMSTDVGKSKSFYGKLFDWELEDVPLDDGTYTMIKVGEGTGGGLMKNPMPNATSSWLAYVQVEDLKKAVAKARSLGGTVMKDKTDVMGMGSLAIINDPTGAMFGLWEPKKS
jgi:predicted enzyme related to lactoylglutathione lyase